MSWLAPTRTCACSKPTSRAEGYEPQVLLTAKKMLRMRRVRAVQLELTRAKDPEQVQANINMLKQLV